MAKYCSNCGNKVVENAYICPKCGVVVNNSLSNETNNKQSVDNGGFGWGILGFFVPLAGLIIFLTMKDTKPKTASACGKGALVSVILGFVFAIVIFVILGIMFNIFASNI